MGIEETQKRFGLHLRLPVKVKDEEQIRNLNKRIAHVQIPRQTSNWCFVYFARGEDRVEARKELKLVKINEKPIRVRLAELPIKRKSRKNKGNTAKNSTTEGLRDLLKKK